MENLLIFIKKNPLKMSEFLRNNEVLCCRKIPLTISEFLKNRYFFNEKSPSFILIPEKDDFL
jgi:hypothetical protein